MTLVQRYEQMPRRLQVLIVAGWVLAALFTVSITIAGLPFRANELLQACNETPTLLPAESCTTLLLGSEILFAIGFIGLAIFPVWLRSSDPIAMLLAITLVAFSITQAGMGRALVREYPAFEIPFRILVSIAAVGALTILYIFPDGRFVPKWTRFLALAWAIFAVTGLLWKHIPGNPIYADVWQSTAWFSVATAVGWFGSGAIAQIIRYRKFASSNQQQQIRWIATGLILAAIGGLIEYARALVGTNFILPGATSTLFVIARPILAKLLLLCAPICIVVAVLYYQLWGVPAHVSRWLHWLLLTTVVFSLYIAIVTVLSKVLLFANDSMSIILTTTIIGVLFHQLRTRTQHAVNRLIYGDLYHASQLLENLEDLPFQTMAEEILPTIVQTVRKALKLSYVAIELVQYDRTIEKVAEGEPVDDPLKYALIYQRRFIGNLYVGSHGLRQSPIFARYDSALKKLANQASKAVYTVYLLKNLRDLSDELVKTRAEERRDIRDRLHSGLLNQIWTIIDRLNDARQKLHCNVLEGDAALQQVIEQTKQVRASADAQIQNIHLPVFDIGLRETLESLIEEFHHSELSIALEAPYSLPKFHAAVMETVYYITKNALSNVRKHARAHRCVVMVKLKDDLYLDIIDFGQGLPPEFQPHIGVPHMSRLAEKHGGSCRIEPAPHGGTAVRVRLPAWLASV